MDQPNTILIEDTQEQTKVYLFRLQDHYRVLSVTEPKGEIFLNPNRNFYCSIQDWPSRKNKILALGDGIKVIERD